MRKYFAYAGLFCWFIALPMPALPACWFATGGDPGDAHWPGYFCLLFGFLGPLAHGLCGWYSNIPFALAGVILLKGGAKYQKNLAICLVLISILLSLTTFLPFPPPPSLPDLVMHRGRESVDAIFHSLGIGYWIWFSSILLMGAAALSRPR